MLEEKIIQRVAEGFGTPVYVYDRRHFEASFEALNRAYAARYPRFQIAYSLKTNYAPPVLASVRALKGFAEVVSGTEYSLAKLAGFKPQEIILNGPGKAEGLSQALLEGALVMLDNEEELKEACRLAQERPEREMRLGLRMNFTLGEGKSSRFGFDALGEEAEQGLKRLRQVPNIRVCGLHFHLSGARSLNAWEKRARELSRLMKTLLLPGEREVLDLGSGMFGPLEAELACQFPQEKPSFEAYAEAVTRVLKEEFPEPDQAPLLVVEPGSTLVASAFEFVTRVKAVKSIRGREIAVVDGSSHQAGELCRKKSLPLRVYSEKPFQEGAPNGCEISGYTCLEEDILYTGLKRRLFPGDLLSFGNVGSYSLSLKPPFIQADCPVVEVDSLSGQLSLKRQKQDAQSFIRDYTASGVQEAYVHPSSFVDEDVQIGRGSKIWHFCHIQSGARVGENCSLGQNVNVSQNVSIGRGCKIQNNVSLYEGVTLEDHVFCGPSCVFTNDLTPRAKYPKGPKAYLKTRVCRGASVGANATIVCGHEIGEWAMIASGAVVTSDVPKHALMLGVPARQKGWVCECGAVLPKDLLCRACGRAYRETQAGLQQTEGKSNGI